jgi:arylsulfatase A-like enzyme
MGETIHGLGPLRFPSRHDGSQRALPDVVIIVLDCVREDFFSGGRNEAPGQPFLASLSSQCKVFPRAIAPAPWTMPSHATLLTGLAIWEHGMHHRGFRRPAAARMSLATRLSSFGYQSASFSANPYVCAESGLTKGFQLSWTGFWYEGLFRGISLGPSYSGSYSQHSSVARLDGSTEVGPISHVLQRWPGPMNSILKLISSGRQQAVASPMVGPWIEPKLRQWLRATRADQPIFAFINLMDSHEPYIGVEPSVDHEQSARGGFSSPRQDHFHWLTGEWSPSKEEWRALRALARGTYATLDRRIQSVIEILRESHRWDNCVLIITSDHGQAFGEGGLMFHGLSTNDAMIRVPLWVRDPAKSDLAIRTASWISLRSIPEIVTRILSHSLSGEVSSEPRCAEPQSDFESAVLSIADGLSPWIRRQLRANRLNELDRPSVSVYTESGRLTLDWKTRKIEFSRYNSDGSGTEIEESDERFKDAVRCVKRAAELTFSSFEDSSEIVGSRLSAWGYV